jgi:membrane protein
VPLLAAGVAFYALLSLFPALVAVISLYGLVSDPADVARQLEDITQPLPPEISHLLITQVESIAGSSSGGLGFSAIFGIVAALWSASSGMKWLLSAISLTYDQPEGRGFVKLRGTALLLTLGAAVGLVVSVGLIAATPVLSRAVGLESTGTLVASVLRWPVLAALVVVGLAVIYRYGPDRDPAKWRWVSWGSGIATVIWLVSSGAFALYASVAGDFNKSYGTLGGFVALMLWLYLTALSVLLGAEINAEMERQTARDTTRGPDRPLGERHATVADEVGQPYDAPKPDDDDDGRR